MAAEEGAEPALDFLKQKVGPLPAGVWIGLFGAAWWYLQKRQKGGASNTVGSNQQTDPAGNVGPIDPATGYVYGTPEDSAAAASNGASTGTVTGTGGSTTGGAYPDNQTWATAAINYLVGIGIDPTAANSAITQFLASQALTTQQQADVNSAIQRLGAPPSPPQPGTAPSPIVTPPSPGTVYASNPPSGLVVTSKAASSVGLKWNAATNASGYTVSYGTTSAATGGSLTVTGTATSTTISGLQANTLYYFRVQGTPAKSGDGFASTSATTAKAAASTPTPTGPPADQKYTTVTVVKWTPSNTPWNSTLSGIAAHYNVKGGYQALAKLNGISNPDHIEVGQKIKVPIS